MVLSGACHVKVTLWFPATAVKFCGALGACETTNEEDGCEATEFPAAFVATTLEV